MDNAEFLKGASRRSPSPRAVSTVVIYNFDLQLLINSRRTRPRSSGTSPGSCGRKVGSPVSDVVADPDLDDNTRRDRAQWTGCIVGALTSDHYRSLLESARDVEHWVRTLRDGGHRSRPRTLETVWGYLNEIQPILLVWSSRHDHLREVTCNDILGAVELLHGSKRRHTVSTKRTQSSFSMLR